jgi:hypothetical protein
MIGIEMAFVGLNLFERLTLKLFLLLTTSPVYFMLLPQDGKDSKVSYSIVASMLLFTLLIIAGQLCSLTAANALSNVSRMEIRAQRIRKMTNLKYVSWQLKFLFILLEGLALKNSCVCHFNHVFTQNLSFLSHIANVGWQAGGQIRRSEIQRQEPTGKLMQCCLLRFARSSATIDRGPILQSYFCAV